MRKDGRQTNRSKGKQRSQRKEQELLPCPLYGISTLNSYPQVHPEHAPPSVPCTAARHSPWVPAAEQLPLSPAKQGRDWLWACLGTSDPRPCVGDSEGPGPARAASRAGFHPSEKQGARAGSASEATCFKHDTWHSSSAGQRHPALWALQLAQDFRITGLQLIWWKSKLSIP